MKIALIDSGVDISHNCFFDAKIERADLFRNGNVNDENGHGTLSAGEILCINPKAEIISIKILDQNNSGNLQALVSALEYCLGRKDIDIINMSLTCQIVDTEIEAALKDLVEGLRLNRVLVLCSEPNYKNKGRYIHQLSGIYAVRGEYRTNIDECTLDGNNEQIIYYGSHFLRPAIQNDYKLFRGNSSFTARTTGVLSKNIRLECNKNYKLKIRSGVPVRSINVYNASKIYKTFSNDAKLLELLMNPLSFLNSVQQYGFIHTIKSFGIFLPDDYLYTDISLEHFKKPECIIEKILEYNSGKINE